MSFINPNKTMREMLIRNHKRSISHLLCFMNLHTGLSESEGIPPIYIYILPIYIFMYVYIYITYLYIYPCVTVTAMLMGQ
jgi:hypothetical protein